jgi:hypothetical protein
MTQRAAMLNAQVGGVADSEPRMLLKTIGIPAVGIIEKQLHG